MRKNGAGTGMNPPSPVTGSMITAATFVSPMSAWAISVNRAKASEHKHRDSEQGNFPGQTGASPSTPGQR